MENKKEYNEYLIKFLKKQKEKYGNSFVTPGEFFGFRRAYEVITGNIAPSYKRIGIVED